MLIRKIRPTEDPSSGIDSVHNYYENLVIEQILHTSEQSRSDRELLADVACVALNSLPPRYIRHDVDMTFFMSAQDIQEVQNKVANAVQAALAYVKERELARKHKKDEPAS